MKADPASSVRVDLTDKQAPETSAARPSRACWLVFAGAIVVSIFIHELGHCTVPWLYGYPAIPTPAKEYILKPLPEGLQNQMALGGIIGSVIALVAASLWFHFRPSAISSAMLAGAMTPPGFYSLRFILAGRGHDGTEFQEAQAALGLSYAGHGVDWLFVGLFVAVTVFWFWRTGAPARIDWHSWHVVAFLAMILGAGVLVRCIWDFAVSGRGTLAPVDPPKDLVVRGLYRYVRNPMYVGVLLILLGEAWLFKSQELLIYATGCFATVHAFVVLYEERTLRRKFGGSYSRYCQTVNRWLPKRPPR